MQRALLAATILAVLAAISVLPPAAVAQQTGGTITGTVTDGTHAAVPDASVDVTNTDTNGTLSVATNATGEFNVPFLTPGHYRVTVRKEGFKQMVRGNLELRVADVVNLQLELELGQLADSVTVTTEAPLLATSEASHSAVMDRTRIDELPIRDGSSAELVVLAPGVANATDNRPRKAAFTGGLSQVNTNGGMLYGNEWTLDGIPNMAGSPGANKIAFSPPLEALEEFKIQTSTYDASQGHSPGAVYNMVTRGGNNQFHGEAHWWFKNKVLDANDFFNNMNNTPRANYKDNRYGFAVGGPVWIPKVYNGHNKTFWFFTWEANPFDQVVPVVTTTPTAAEKQGDFSSLLALGSKYQIYDPYSTVPTGTGHATRNPFPNNIIPASMISSNPSAKAVQALLKYWPDANIAASTVDGRNNFNSPTPLDATTYRTYNLRIDQNISDKHKLFGRFNWDYWQEDADNTWGNIVNGEDNYRHNRLLAIDDVYIISSAMVLNTRLGITRSPVSTLPRSMGKTDLAGLGFSSALSGLIPQGSQSFPNITGVSFGSLGTTSYSFNNDDTRSLSSTLAWQKGKHSIRIGGDFRMYYLNAASPLRAVSPSIGFGTAYVTASDTATAPSYAGGFASFLLGLPQSGSMAVTNGYSLGQTWWGGFLHDDWKVSSKLTLNLGLRYELENPVTERYNRMVGDFDPNATLSITQQAVANYAAHPISDVAASQFKVQGGYVFLSPSDRQLWKRHDKNFMPRFGFAYQLDKKTVMRGGYGIYFDILGIGRASANQTGFSRTTNLVGSLDLGQTYTASLVNPFPTGLLAPVGSSLGVNQDLGLSVSFPNRNLRTPYSQNWSFGVQRMLPGKLVLDTSYVGTRGTALGIGWNYNFVPQQYLSTSQMHDQAAIDYLGQQVTNPFAGLLPGTGLNGATISRQQLLYKYPQFSSVTTTQSAGSSWYHSLQMSLERRYSNGLTLTGGFTFAKAMMATGYLNPTDTRPQHVLDTSNPGKSYNVTAVYQLPFGRGRTYGGSWHGVTEAVLGGWQVGALLKGQAGFPSGVANSIVLPGHNICEANNSATRSWRSWFDFSTAFDTVPNDQPTGANIRTLSTAFGCIRGPGYYLLDTNLSKTFTLRENVKAQLRGEAFNSDNHVNLGQWPGWSPSTPGSSQITNTNGYCPRTVQLALKLMF
jgi:hypothetical protein